MFVYCAIIHSLWIPTPAWCCWFSLRAAFIIGIKIGLLLVRQYPGTHCFSSFPVLSRLISVPARFRYTLFHGSRESRHLRLGPRKSAFCGRGVSRREHLRRILWLYCMLYFNVCVLCYNSIVVDSNSRIERSCRVDHPMNKDVLSIRQYPGMLRSLRFCLVFPTWSHFLSVRYFAARSFTCKLAVFCV